MWDYSCQCPLVKYCNTATHSLDSAPRPCKQFQKDVTGYNEAGKQGSKITNLLKLMP